MSTSTLPTFEAGLVVGNNTIYVPGGSATVSCGGTTLTFEEFQGRGYDLGSHLVPALPNASTIIQWASALLL